MNTKRKRQGEKYLFSGLLLTLVMLMFLITPNPVLASDTGVIRLAVQPGLSGIYKLDFPAGLVISVSNQGKACQGVLVVEPDVKSRNNQQNRNEDIQYRKTIDMPTKSLVTTNLMVPSELLNKGAQVVLLVNEQPVAVTPIQGTAVNGGLIALSLGEKPLNGGFPAWLDQTFGGQTAIKYMEPTYLPDDPIELLQANIIIVDDVALRELNKKQLTTLKDWVSLGGMLLLSGGAGSSSGGSLTDISPVVAEKQEVIPADLGGLQEVKGNMTISSGPLTEGEILAQVKDTILIAARDFGKGRVIFSGIPLENLTSESNRVWSLIFGRADSPSKADTKMQMTWDKRSLDNNLLHASTYLPQIKTPPVPQVALAWVVYVLVIGPVLYLVLKRYDRRDCMWWIIPTCAMITTGAVYFMSPAQKIHAPISQTLSVLEILDNERAELNATASFISPYGGTLRVEGARGSVVWPANFNQTNKMPIIHYDRTTTPSLSFPDVEYWSMRQASATAFKKNVGSIQGNLTLEDGYITGKIQNNTDMELKNCKILLGGRPLVLKNIPAGGYVTVKQSLAKWPESLGPNEFRDLLVPPVNPGQSDNYIRERQMVDAVLEPSEFGQSNQPVFYGWSDDSQEIFKILSDRGNVRNYNLTLVTQRLNLEIADGQVIKLPSGMYRPKIIETRGAFNETPLGFTLYEGKIVLSINLARPLKSQKIKVETVEIPAQTNKNLVLKIYDWQNKKWLNVPVGGLKLKQDQLKQYGATGELRIQIEKVSNLGQTDRVDLPAVSVKGGKS
ncbi:hypothetical protein Dred_1355 [Desulforamulus reducens MI-1]|uniref:DUF4350 domain-containing protein n=1 Tax=Desulforamulus reducens (strain ATCC BAA-1160 / DSM 100696 / MI-1) TaxID=349161 RepID=A4J486_DESRM|nr:hypothetical protein [Desulforamulus reducens]ABO49889.1 hypothetical protein Dred_1355 [Desulforamulus reducens MI-1]